MMKSQNKGTIGNIGDELTSFGDISAFMGEEDGEDTALRNYRDSAGNKKTKRKLNRKMKAKLKKKGHRFKKK